MAHRPLRAVREGACGSQGTAYFVSVIEAAVQVMGEKLVTDPERQDTYRQARKMAHEGNAAIEPISAVAA
jgi:hypothetical protein